jgi:hypothetical protein
LSKNFSAKSCFSLCRHRYLSGQQRRTSDKIETFFISCAPLNFAFCQLVFFSLFLSLSLSLSLYVTHAGQIEETKKNEWLFPKVNVVIVVVVKVKHFLPVSFMFFFWLTKVEEKLCYYVRLTALKMSGFLFNQCSHHWTLCCDLNSQKVKYA